MSRVVNNQEQFVFVFVWKGDQKPNNQTTHERLPIRFIECSTLSEATTVFNPIADSCWQIFHTSSVPANALAWFGGTVLRGGINGTRA